jgi:hypothetical protein
MGEKRILTEEEIDRKLSELRPRQVVAIDPMRMAEWTLETCCAMVDDAISVRAIERAIAERDLDATKTGKRVTVEPAKFLVWYRRHRK